MLHWVTDFGDQAVVEPAVIAVAFALAWQRRGRVVVAWLLAICAVLGTIGVLKVLCYACGWLWPVLAPEHWDVRSPSGHVASAAVLYGSFAALLAGGQTAARRWTATLAAATLAGAGIGLTRVLLGAHSPAEVVIGIVVGVGGALAFALMTRRTFCRSARPAIAALALVLCLQHGRHLEAEQVIRERGATTVRALLPACSRR